MKKILDFRLEVHKLDEINLINNHKGKSYFGEQLQSIKPECATENCHTNTKAKIEDFVVQKDNDDDVDRVYSCETLRMCIITTLNWGLRNGGGIGDVLRNVDPQVKFELKKLKMTLLH